MIDWKARPPGLEDSKIFDCADTRAIVAAAMRGRISRRDAFVAREQETVEGLITREVLCEMPQRVKKSGHAWATGWKPDPLEVTCGKPREIRFHTNNVNPNYYSPISMELLAHGSEVMVVVASTNSRDRAPPVSSYLQLLRPREES
jgi:hypothetical protein